MSKLKRKKTAAEETKREQQCKDKTERLRIADATRHGRDAGPPAGGGSSCWTSADHSEVEMLWLKTLQDLCPQLTAEDMTVCVPPVPPLSTEQEEQSVWHWCSLDEDVTPFPVPPFPHSQTAPVPPSHSPHTARVLPSPMSTSCPQERSGHLNEGSKVREYELDANGVVEGDSAQGLEHSRPECSSDAITRTFHTSTFGSEPESSTPAGSSDGIKLQSCPMCLTPFPSKFSQMECDGHLAQCLSEMNEDVVW